MAIALGRSLTHPTYVLAQIVYVVSLFLLLLGCARVAVDATGLLWRLLRRADGGTQSVTLASLRCFHVSVTSLFTAYPSHVQRSSSSSSTTATTTTTTTTTTAAPATRVVMSQDGAGLFLLTHAVAAVLLAHPLSVLLQRRKVVLDFVATLYAVYIVLSCVVLRRVPPPNTLSWLFALLCGACTLTAMTWYMCRRRELQYVSLSSDMTGVSSDAHVASGGSAAGVHGASGASHGVHAPSSSTMTMAVAASSPAYAAVAGNAVLGGGGVGVATVAGHAGATAGGAGVGHGSNATVTPAAVPTALSPRAQRLEHAAGIAHTTDVVEMEQLSSSPSPPPPTTAMTVAGDDGRWHVRTAAGTHAATSALPTTGETASGVAPRGTHGMLHHMGGVAMPGYAAKRKTN